MIAPRSCKEELVLGRRLIAIRRNTQRIDQHVEGAELDGRPDATAPDDLARLLRQATRFRWLAVPTSGLWSLSVPR